MKTFPSIILRVIGRLEVAGADGTCVICGRHTNAPGHDETCLLKAALEEAEIIAQECTEPHLVYAPPIDPNAPQVWYGTGPATWEAPSVKGPPPSAGTTV